MNCQVMVKWLTQMEINIKVNLKMEKRMERGLISTLMETLIKVIGLMIKNPVKDNTIIKMIIVLIQVLGKIIWRMDLVFLNILMVISMKESLRMERDMVEVNSIGKLVKFSMVLGLMMWWMVKEKYWTQMEI